MDKVNDIKNIQTLFINDIKSFLQKDKYNLKKNRFIAKSNDNIFSIVLNFYKRPTFIEIQTQSYYGNSRIESMLMETFSKYEYKEICGGDTRFICEYYFKQTYNQQYSNIICNFDTPIIDNIKLWIDNYNKYIKPFFKDCSSPEILNRIVNEEKIDTTGMNLTYKNRVIKSIFIALLSGQSEFYIINLFKKYEDYLEKKQLPFLSDFLEIKQNLSAKKYII